MIECETAEESGAIFGGRYGEQEFHIHVNFEGGATTGEFLEAWNEFESRTDSLITFDPEEIHRLLTNHKELTFGRINLQKNETEVTISELPECLKGSGPECDIVYLFFTGDFSLIETHDLADKVKSNLSEKTEVIISLRQGDDSDIRLYALALCLH